MKTAKEIIEAMRCEMPFHLPDRLKPYFEEAMKIYAQQVAEDVRQRCADNARLGQSILQTEIITP